MSGLNVYVLQISYVEALTPNVMAFGGGAFGIRFMRWAPKSVASVTGFVS